MKVHLMYQDADFDPSLPLPPNHQDLITDLDLVTLLEAMADGDKYLLGIAQSALLASLDDAATIGYRQQILNELAAQPEVAAELYAIAVAAVDGERRIWGYIRPNPSGLLHRAIEVIGLFLDLLRRLREIADGVGPSFQSPGLATFFQMLSRELDDEFFGAAAEHLRRLREPEKMLISARLGEGNRGVDYVLRSPAAGPGGWRERIGIGSRSGYSFSIPARDEAGGRALSQLSDRGTNLVANALTQSADHILSFFTQLRAELGFYIGGLNLRSHLSGQGQPVCTPVAVGWSPAVFAYAGLYDPCLALRRGPGEVVGNDGQADGKSLVLITGANSGGKSTFLRSVGLAQLMLQCGLFVAADSCRASITGGVFTHFIREEDPSLAQGRLDEDLRRMSEIADRVKPRCLLLFNESFSGTNEREGSEIARQIIRALLEADCRIYFVTHFFELADSFRALQREDVLLLRAQRRADGERSFKVLPGDPLPTAFGQDLYQQLFPGG